VCGPGRAPENKTDGNTHGWACGCYLPVTRRQHQTAVLEARRSCLSRAVCRRSPPRPHGTVTSCSRHRLARHAEIRRCWQLRAHRQPSASGPGSRQEGRAAPIEGSSASASVRSGWAGSAGQAASSPSPCPSPSQLRAQPAEPLRVEPALTRERLPWSPFRCSDPLRCRASGSNPLRPRPSRATPRSSAGRPSCSASRRIWPGQQPLPARRRGRRVVRRGRQGGGLHRPGHGPSSGRGPLPLPHRHPGPAHARHGPRTLRPGLRFPRCRFLRHGAAQGVHQPPSGAQDRRYGLTTPPRSIAGRGLLQSGPGHSARWYGELRGRPAATPNQQVAGSGRGVL
jgi:hypothetical protein